MDGGTDRAPLPMVRDPAIEKPPRVLREGEHRPLQAVSDGDSVAFPIQNVLHAVEIRTVVRPPFEDIILPLMDHLMRQRPDDLLFRLILQERH